MALYDLSFFIYEGSSQRRRQPSLGLCASVFEPALMAQKGMSRGSLRTCLIKPAGSEGKDILVNNHFYPCFRNSLKHE